MKLLLMSSIAVDEFAPGRAFVQIYGFLPAEELKLDYAIYLGNSPNIAARTPENFNEFQQTGVDTTDTFLLGGRIGIRYGEWKIGVSVTRDNTNALQEIAPLFGQQAKEILRYRIGADLAFYLDKFSLESEFISVNHNDDSSELSLDKKFFYGTLGYRISEPLLIYISYWLTKQDFPLAEGADFRDTALLDVIVPTMGFAYNINDRLVLKSQFARGEIKQEIPKLQIMEKTKFNHFSAAVSVIF